MDAAKGKKVDIPLLESQVSNCGNTAWPVKLMIVSGKSYLFFIMPHKGPWKLNQFEIRLKRSA